MTPEERRIAAEHFRRTGQRWLQTQTTASSSRAEPSAHSPASRAPDFVPLPDDWPCVQPIRVSSDRRTTDAAQAHLLLAIRLCETPSEKERRTLLTEVTSPSVADVVLLFLPIPRKLKYLRAAIRIVQLGAALDLSGKALAALDADARLRKAEREAIALSQAESELRHQRTVLQRLRR